MISDTIAAIATAVNNSGISVIRISGEEALAVIDRIYRSKKSGKVLSREKSHTIHYGYIVDQDQIIDEVMVLIMKAPNSYTREDVIEIDCHGGIVVTRRILETVLKNGARAAEPGEFTKRAFLNGRIDLSQAEAVIDVIQAKNEMALDSSVRQLRGGLREKVQSLRDNILRDVAFIEAALDDPEHISVDGFAEDLRTHTENNLNELEELLMRAEDGRMIKEGIRTVIVGKPNAGKSSLLNLLVGDERAIVTNVPGTTRDTLEETIMLRGICLTVIDTAGIRKTDDIVEQIGVLRAKEVMEQADLIIYVVDGSLELDENDLEIIELLQDRKAIVLLNKTDLSLALSQGELEKKTGKPVVPVSAKENQGLAELERLIEQMFFQGGLTYNDEIYITNERHKAAVREARESLKQVISSIENEMPEDFYSIDLMNAYEALGAIIGEAMDEDLVDMIFREFCMGK
ncbi:tRNA uridine-5-carboxymethylaminomethyl(34) synthesis GTPase MnmE [Anaerolentibacter hominis]|uniref:tRNA uridine-5-carboxymethylaminomethyl(34) synthesis GTPase MnmE n=1 Tax=Anaerolentibacter hominis TaxID=3079009 RepID=UPI0031B82A0D